MNAGMEMSGNHCEYVAFVNMLKDCGKNKDLCRGSRLHDDLLKRGLLGKNSYVSSSLVSMYAKCGSLTKAQNLLEEMHVRDVISWSALIAGYAQQGKGLDALNCFEQMKREGISPDAITFTCILKACGSIKAFDKAKQIHNEIISRRVLGKDIHLGTALVDMYAKCGMLTKAQKVLNEFPVRNAIPWNALIAGYSQYGQHDEAANCLERMQSEGIFPNSVTFTCILRACGSSMALSKGKKIHEEITRRGLLEKDIVLGNALIDMYAKCGEIAIAQRVLEELPAVNVVSWTSLIGGYVEHGQSRKALDYFDRMRSEGFFPNAVTFICILKACGITRDVNRGIQIHEEIECRGLLGVDSVLGAALVNLYAKCGKLAKAHKMLAELSIQDVESWNSIITGYSQRRQCRKVLACFEQMRRLGISPNAATLVSILNAYAQMGAIHKGKEVHDEILNMDLLESNVVLGTALVNMYAKCGALGKAAQVLEGLRVRDVMCWYTLIAAYAWHGLCYEALECLKLMENEGLAPDHIIFTCILKTCGNIGAFDWGEPVHDGATLMGFPDEDVMIGNPSMNVNAKLGDANSRFFSQIVYHGKHAHCFQAPNWFHDMRWGGLSSNAVKCIRRLQACVRTGAVDEGEQIHREIASKGLLGKDIVVVGTALIDMYARFGVFGKAQEVLEELPRRDVIAWSALISGYVQQGQCSEALNCFEQMRYEGQCPDAIILACILKACGLSGSLNKGKQIQEEIMHKGLLRNDAAIGTALMDMYAKCGLLEEAEEVMKRLPARDEVTWSALIAGYTKQGRFHEALKCFARMQAEGFSPNEISFVCILKACGSLHAVEDGETMHKEAVYRGLEKHVVLGTALVVFYSKCGVLAKAEHVLEQLPFRDVVSWNALIAGYAQQGKLHEALNCLEQLQTEGLSPNAVTFACVLKACGNAGAVDEGKQIHEEISTRKQDSEMDLLENNLLLGNAVVDMYSKCGNLAKAQEAFEKLLLHDAAAWTTMIAGYAQHWRFHEAMDCFDQMQIEGVHPNATSLTCVLKICSCIGALETGLQIHRQIAGTSMLKGDCILWASLMDLYIGCGAVAESRELLEDLPIGEDFFAALIAVYDQHQQSREILNCFNQMHSKGLAPDAISLTCILKACGSMGASGQGTEAHREIQTRGLLEKDLVLGNALVCMYGRCGSPGKAHQVLEELPIRDVVSWSTLIAGYAEQGRGPEALNCFERMKIEGLAPDGIAFVCLLNACAQSGLVDEARMLFQSMTEECGITPSLEHHVCMMMVSGCAGHIEEMASMIKDIPSSDELVIWLALLGACRKWVNVNLGVFAFDRALQRDSSCAAAYILMADIFAAANLTEDAEKVEDMRVKYASQKTI